MLKLFKICKVFPSFIISYFQDSYNTVPLLSQLRFDIIPSKKKVEALLREHKAKDVLIIAFY